MLGSDGVELCHPLDGTRWGELRDLLNGTPREGQWRPLEVELVHDDEGQQLSYSDAPWLGNHALIFRANARSVLQESLLACGEFLPLASVEADLWVYNAWRIDALDLAGSDVLRLDSGKILGIKRYAFKEDVVRDVMAFRIPDLRGGPVFFEREIAGKWKAAGLKGLEFEPVWVGRKWTKQD